MSADCKPVNAISFRSATEGDFDFIFELHKRTLGPYVDQVWGWDDTDQRTYLQRTIDIAATQIVVIDGVDAGRLNVEHRKDDIYIGLIEIAPTYQGRGIGKRILRSVLDEALVVGKSVRLSVLAVNAGAYELYRRLGFLEVARQGEAPATRIQMVFSVAPTL